MIAVSNEFKKAIKSDERRIKGYVEVLYDVEDVNVSVTSNMTSSYTELSDITQGGRVKQNYGTLDYLPLDGSYLTMDTSNNEDSGFISDDLSGAETGRTFTLNFSSTTLNGITIYYKNNLPDGTYLTFSDGTEGYIEAPEDTGNEIYMQQYIFDTPKTLTSITIEYNLWRYETRKVKIPRIDLGLSAVYKDQDLIEFTVDEEVNKLVEEVPTNETNVTLNNIYDLFNPLNPQGVVKYLSDGSKIIPYIGVLTETQGVEFVKMGEFYFDSYTNNSDETTTLVGKNIIKQLESETFKNDNETDFFQTLFTQEKFESFMENYKYQWDIEYYKTIWFTIYLQHNNLMTLLKDISFINTTLLYGDRNNIMKMRLIDTNIKDQLTKSELLNDVEYKSIEKLNVLNLNRTVTSSGTTTSREIYSGSVVLEQSPQYVLCKISSPNVLGATVSQSGGTSASIVGQAGLFMCFVKVTGNIGDTVTIKLNSTNDKQVGKQLLTKSLRTANEKEVPITIDTDLYRRVDEIMTLENSPSYEINFEYNGDPSLEAGDYINVETPYGYKPVFIQKNRFKFNGGLSGSIEGVE